MSGPEKTDEVEDVLDPWLEVCPHCGADEAHLEVYAQTYMGYRIECPCGAQFQGTSVAEAVAGWNRRTDKPGTATINAADVGMITGL